MQAVVHVHGEDDVPGVLLEDDAHDVGALVLDLRGHVVVVQDEALEDLLQIVELRVEDDAVVVLRRAQVLHGHVLEDLLELPLLVEVRLALSSLVAISELIFVSMSLAD